LEEWVAETPCTPFSEKIHDQVKYCIPTDIQADNAAVDTPYFAANIFLSFLKFLTD
jgi:hypothetical protein